MSDTKMLQAIVDTTASIRGDIKVLKSDIKRLEEKMDEGFKKVNGRIDNLGSQLAYLEDDAPTRKEHDRLEKRVRKLEIKVAS